MKTFKTQFASDALYAYDEQYGIELDLYYDEFGVDLFNFECFPNLSTMQKYNEFLAMSLERWFRGYLLEEYGITDDDILCMQYNIPAEIGKCYHTASSILLASLVEAEKNGRDCIDCYQHFNKESDVQVEDDLQF